MYERAFLLRLHAEHRQVRLKIARHAAKRNAQGTAESRGIAKINQSQHWYSARVILDIASEAGGILLAHSASCGYRNRQRAELAKPAT